MEADDGRGGCICANVVILCVKLYTTRELDELGCALRFDARQSVCQRATEVSRRRPQEWLGVEILRVDPP